MKKRICFTLDLEPDFGGRLNTYSSLDDISYFVDVIRKNKIKLTTFVTGKIFEDKKDTVKELIEIGSEMELHSYSHQTVNRDEVYEIKKSKKAYIEYFGKKPIGYRAPQGIISLKGLKTLADEKFEYDSSIYPTFVPGRYNNLKYPSQPFYFEKFCLIEIPFSVIPVIRLPLAMGYVQPLGLWTSKTMINIFGLPDIIVFDFHLWNLYKPDGTSKLSLKWRQLSGRNLEKGMKMFEEFVKMFDDRGFKPAYMSEIYDYAKEKLNAKKLRVY